MIGVSKLTLIHILRRTKDVDEGVRKTAYKTLADKVHIKSLKIAQREDLLQRGLDDRADGVRAVVENDLITNWLRFCNGSVVDLIYNLDVCSSKDGKVVGKMLKAFFKNTPHNDLVEAFNDNLDERKLIPEDKLSPETTFYWRHLATLIPISTLLTSASICVTW